MRQYGEVPPWLAALNTPSVKSTSGLGTGGGAGVFSQDSGGFGEIQVFIGPGFSANGNVVLNFPNTPPTLFISGDGAFGTLSQATVGNNVTLSWTGATFKSPGASKTYRLRYEWSSSQ